MSGPFTEPSDNERTIIRPRPGGQAMLRPASTRAIRSPAGRDDAPVPAVGPNPLIAAAAPLLEAVIRLADLRGGRVPEIDALRRGLVDTMQGFEKTALATGLDTTSLRAARYALCATVDDVILSTPWGEGSGWAQQTLTSIFHNDGIGGERFFEIMEQMQRELGRHSEVVELMYVCISLGFEGRYRVMHRGVAALTELREGSYRAIRTRRGEFERELSPHWQGLESLHRPLAQRLPLWSIGLATICLLCVIYLGFNFALAGRSDVAAAALGSLPPSGIVAVPRAQAAAPPPPPLPVVVDAGAAAKLHEFLAPEIARGQVTVFADAQTVTVRLANTSMFASGSAELGANQNGLLGRIGDALESEKGNVFVNGYTDSQKIKSPRFPSNFELSQARAESVAAVIGTHLSDPRRLHPQGKGETNPIASNATAAGRQENRRTEIVLMRSEEP